MMRMNELSVPSRLMVVGGFSTLEVTSEVELRLSAVMLYELFRFQNLTLIPCENLREIECFIHPISCIVHLSIYTQGISL